MGVYNTETTGIKPQLGEVSAASAVSAAGSAGAGPTTRPVIESEPLGGAQALSLSVSGCAFALLFVIGTAVLWS